VGLGGVAMSTTISLDEFEVETDDADEFNPVWRLGDLESHVDGPLGDHLGQLLITLGVDGYYNTVHAYLSQGAMVPVLNEAIRTLTLIRDAAARLPMAPGRCMKYGDTGRCRAQQGEPCVFPTEAEMYAEIDASAARRRLRAARQ